MADRRQAVVSTRRSRCCKTSNETIITKGDKFFVQREVKPQTLKAQLTRTIKDLENAESQMKWWAEKRNQYQRDKESLEKVLGNYVEVKE